MLSLLARPLTSGQSSALLTVVSYRLKAAGRQQQKLNRTFTSQLRASSHDKGLSRVARSGTLEGMGMFDIVQQRLGCHLWDMLPRTESYKLLLEGG